MLIGRRVFECLNVSMQVFTSFYSNGLLGGEGGGGVAPGWEPTRRVLKGTEG